MSTTKAPTDVAATIEPPIVTPSPADFFDDMEALKLAQEEAGISDQTEEVVTHAPVRKPMKHEYFRVHPAPENRFTTVVYEDKATREFFIVAPKMIPKLRAISEVSVVTLVLFMTKQKVMGIFPLKMGGSTGSAGWQSTALAATELAKTTWVRMQADMALAGYRVMKAKGDLGEPEWPEMPFKDILNVAFKDRVIASEDHPVFNTLLGRA